MSASTAATDVDGLIHLRAAGTSLLLDARSSRLPAILHWGIDLGADADLAAIVAATTPPPARAGSDSPQPLALLPERASAYSGRPGLSGHRDGRDWSTSFTTTRIQRTGGHLVIEAKDETAGLSLRTELDLTPAGLLRLQHTLRNDGQTAYTLAELAIVLPISTHATEILDLTGKWIRERHPQRRPFHQGAWVRDNRRGHTGHDSTIGIIAGSQDFTFRTGEAWAIHLGWSGNHRTYAERHFETQPVLGAAELLEPGEVILRPGEEYSTPWAYAAYSDRGIDGVSAAFHRWLRSRPQHPGPDRPRPIVLNTWEAVYFDHDMGRLTALADAAAEIGAERYVLDDGWFRHRRDDHAGLGDWYVDEGVYPDGLTPLIDHVTGLGMQFGLWVEPEMVNPDSDLYRAHPDWILAAGGRIPPPARRQQVLDVSNPDVYAYLLERLDSLLTEHDISYLKWDHNRDLVEAGRSAAGHDGPPGVHFQTLAVYRLIDELKSRHPNVEIESCSGGGARVDLGILQRTDRVWGSDCNDALERQTIQRYTSVFLAPELIGAHIGPTRSHSTSRTHDLPFRAITALFGHLGLEWDITQASDEDRTWLTGFLGFAKQVRPVLHTGEVVRVEHPDPAWWVHGVVAQDRSEAVFALVLRASSAFVNPGLARIPGLDPDRRYRVALGPSDRTRFLPPWAADGGELTTTGRALATVGVQMPSLDPEHAALLHITEE